MSSAALRPGAALGGYPERAETRDGGLEGVLSRALDAITGTRELRAARMQRFVSLVEAEGAALRGCDAAAIDEQVRELRRGLAGQGLGDVLVARSFALTRELADRTLGMRHFEAQLIGGRVM